MNRLAWVMVALGIAILAGCAVVRLFSPFDVAAWNVGAEKLDEVQVEFGGFSHSFGIISPGGGKNYSWFEGRWPKQATVRWRYYYDRAYMPDHEATVSIPARPSERGHERTTLRFHLDGENVSVHTETYDYGWIDEHVREVEAEERRAKPEARKDKSRD